MGGRRVAFTVAAGAILFGLANVAIGAPPLDVIAAVVLGGALGLCRSRPTAAWLLGAAAIIPTAPETASSLVPIPFVAATAFGAGRWATRRSAIAAAVALIGLSVLCAAVSDSSGVPAVLLPGLGWIVGRAIHERELITRRLSDRAHELEAEQEAYAELSLRYERARIASELHDIVAHAISVMVVQASAGQRLAGTDPDQTAEAFDAIADAARHAEADMGRLVMLLADEQALADAPDLELIEQLVARAADTGLDVTLRLEGTQEALPAAAVETATRVVREGLTNALRYASGAPVRILIRGERDTIVVEVANEPAISEAMLADHGTGNGLRGLRERLDAYGGQLYAGATEDGGWLVRAEHPRTPI